MSRWLKMDYEARYSAYRHTVETALQSLLQPSETAYSPGGIPRQLLDAMRYSLLGGGKRVRAVLLLAASELIGAADAQVVPFAMAVEIIHTYSLIHDDLPAMDNDDFRRGKPSSHKAFGEAAAILAGDALLNLAFETMAASDHPRALPALREIASRSGSRGMIAGQWADIAMEQQPPDVAMLDYIHRHKTADMIVAPVLAGLMLSDATSSQLQWGEEYALHLGLAFQIVDDILDAQGDPRMLGKGVGKDAAAGKLTWPGMHGIKASREAALEHTRRAVDALGHFGVSGRFLVQLAQNSLQRVQ